MSTYLFIFLFCFRVAISFTNVALTVNLSELTGNAYINVLLGGCTELPAVILVYFVITHLGRKPAVVGCLLFIGITSWLSVPFELFEGKYKIWLNKHLVSCRVHIQIYITCLCLCHAISKVDSFFTFTFTLFSSRVCWKHSKLMYSRYPPYSYLELRKKPS